MTYSFTNIFRIEAVRQLVLATLFRSMSGSMLFLLNINGSSPLHPVTYVSYVAGGAVSFFIIVAVNLLCGAVTCARCGMDAVTSFLHIAFVRFPIFHTHWLDFVHNVHAASRTF